VQHSVLLHSLDEAQSPADRLDSPISLQSKRRHHLTMPSLAYLPYIIPTVLLCYTLVVLLVLYVYRLQLTRKANKPMNVPTNGPGPGSEVYAANSPGGIGIAMTAAGVPGTGTGIHAMETGTEIGTEMGPTTPASVIVPVTVSVQTVLESYFTFLPLDATYLSTFSLLPLPLALGCSGTPIPTEAQAHGEGAMGAETAQTAAQTQTQGIVGEQAAQVILHVTRLISFCFIFGLSGLWSYIEADWGNMWYFTLWNINMLSVYFAAGVISSVIGLLHHREYIEYIRHCDAAGAGAGADIDAEKGMGVGSVGGVGGVGGVGVGGVSVGGGREGRYGGDGGGFWSLHAQRLSILLQVLHQVASASYSYTLYVNRILCMVWILYMYVCMYVCIPVSPVCSNPIPYTIILTLSHR
jgi:hypothetical protein